MKHFYRAQGRYGYIGIELFEEHPEHPYGRCVKTVITGILPQKLGRQFAELLQQAYEQGRHDATLLSNEQFDKIVKEATLTWGTDHWRADEQMRTFLGMAGVNINKKEKDK